MTAKPSSPCVEICRIDPATELCIGCKRTVYEIALWSRLNEDQRLAIMAGLPTRTEAPELPRLERRGGRRARVG